MIISTPFPPEEGIGYHVYNISRNLMQRGHTVTIITRGSLQSSSIINVDGIKVIRMPYVPFYPFHVHIHGLILGKYLNSIKKDFDIVHIHSPLAPVIKTSIPIINTLHTSLIEDALHIEKNDVRSVCIKLHTKYVSYHLIQNLIKESVLTTTVSNNVVEELKKYYGCKDPIVVGNGVDEEIFCPNRTESDYIFTACRLSYRKGLFDLIQSAKYIDELGMDIKFLIAGKGELEGVLKERVQRLGLTDKVLFLGHVERAKLIELYQCAKLVVMPSHYESGPLTLLEAMSCGKPVISTSVGIAPEIIINSENGILVPIKSPKSISHAINALLLDDQLREKMGRNARAAVTQQYAWSKVTDRLEDCYNTALQIC